MNVIETIAPVTHDLGQFEVRRVLPAKSRTMVGPLRQMWHSASSR